MTPEECEARYKQLDRWYNGLGVNVLPWDTRNNKPVLGSYEFYHTHAVMDNEYRDWKAAGLFDKGAITTLGRAWRKKGIVGKDKDLEYYLFCIDIDIAGYIKEIGPLEQILKRYYVEGHANTPGKYHVFGYSTYQIPNARLEMDGRVVLEVFSNNHLMNISPSWHEDNSQYAAIEGCNLNPDVNDGIVNFLEQVFRKHGQEYLTGNNSSRSTVVDNDAFMFNEPFIYEGERWTKLSKKVPLLLAQHIGKMPLDDIKQIVLNYNQKYCKPPFPINELEIIWINAVKLIGKKAKDREQRRKEREKSLDEYQDGLTIVRPNTLLYAD